MPALLVQRDLKGLSLADQAANCRPESARSRMAGTGSTIFGRLPVKTNAWAGA